MNEQEIDDDETAVVMTMKDVCDAYVVKVLVVCCLIFCYLFRIYDSVLEEGSFRTVKVT